MTNITEEIWKDAYGFDGYYQVSNIGRVRSVSRYVKNRYSSKLIDGIVLSPGISKGYYQVNLCVNGRQSNQYVHRLVMSSFNGYSKLTVDHKDENKLNNNLNNLRYATFRQNNIFYQERRKHKRSSKYLGVSWKPSRKRWVSHITVNGKRTHLGCFEDEYLAHLTYQSAVEKMSQNR